MLFKTVIFGLLALSVVNADLATITADMRNTIEWLNKNSELDHNSTILLAIAGGSMLKQGSGGIQTEVQNAYLNLTVVLSKELLEDTNAEARLYFCTSLFEFVGDFSPAHMLVNSAAVSPDSVYEIYTKSQPSQIYKDCLYAFYDNNPELHKKPTECNISPDCKAAILDSSPQSLISPVLRNRFVMFAKNLHNCNNFNEDYDTIIAKQMEQVNEQVNAFLANIVQNEGKLDPRLRYFPLRRINLMAMNGYDVITPMVEEYLNSLYNEEGYCGLPEDELIDKVVLSSQCYAIWAFKRQILLAKEAVTPEE